MCSVSILDEPTAGLDPESRRDIWNVLLELRKQHCIMITTHCMEEAEVLADYIYIMSNGCILCTGTTMQLKRKYAVGYSLKLMMAIHFDLVRIMKMVQKYVPEAKLVSFVVPTCIILLPYEYFNIYSNLLHTLEETKKSMGVAAISMTDATLEDVFLNCDRGDDSIEENTEDCRKSARHIEAIGLCYLCY